MVWTGMGKVTVVTAGTPVALSATRKKANTIMVSFDPADTSATVYLKDSYGNIIGALSSANPNPIVVPCGSADNALDLSNFSVDVSVNGKGPFVGYGVS